MTAIGDVSPDRWNALLSEGSCPFLEHGYLASLERSGVLARNSFHPCHITAWSGDRLVAALPAYLKDDERGEPLPDWARELARKHEIPYGSTLFVGIPLTTVSCSKLLTAPGIDREHATELLVHGARDAVAAQPVPAIHVYLTDDAECELFARHGFHRRVSVHPTWINDGYTSFADFAGRLRSHSRYNIVRERRVVADAQVRFRSLRGAEITESTMDLVWELYRYCIGKYGGELDTFSKEYFTLQLELFRHRLVVFVAERGSTVVAGSLNVEGSRSLYLRLWGALEPQPFLHYNAYYHAMDEAIANRLASVVDSGGLTPHKLARGFAPTVEHSASWIGDEDLHDAMSSLLARERTTLERIAAEHRERSPFKRAPGEVAT